MRVKICGITSIDDAKLAAQAGADFIGLILAASPRCVTLETARQVAAGVSNFVRPVLVFRDAPIEDVCAAIDATGCGWVQLHGREPVTYLTLLAQYRPHAHIMRGWPVSGPQCAQDLRQYLEKARDLGTPIEVVILDAPKGGPHPGFEFMGDVALSFADRPPQIWCAGGLTAGNLTTAVASGRYDGVDVASGVEAKPGIKDPEALRKFVTTAKSSA